jgi:hypothetical protein
MRWLLAGIVGLLALVGTAAAHEQLEGKRAVVASDLALSRGDVREAIAQARSGAEAAVPGSVYPTLAYARLEAIARAAEAGGRLDDAAFAWRAMRSAARATEPAESARGRAEQAEHGIVHVAALPRPGHHEGGALAAPERLLRQQLASDGLPAPIIPMALAWATLAAFLGLARYSAVRGARPEHV